MAAAVQLSCNQNICHALQGTAYFFKGCCTLIAVAVIVAAIAAVALAPCVGGSVLFQYAGTLASTHLFWIFPVVSILMLIGIVLSVLAGELTREVCDLFIGDILRDCKDDMLKHYRAISFCH